MAAQFLMAQSQYNDNNERLIILSFTINSKLCHQFKRALMDYFPAGRSKL